MMFTAWRESAQRGKSPQFSSQFSGGVDDTSLGGFQPPSGAFLLMTARISTSLAASSATKRYPSVRSR